MTAAIRGPSERWRGRVQLTAAPLNVKLRGEQRSQTVQLFRSFTALFFLGARTPEFVDICITFNQWAIMALSSRHGLTRVKNHGTLGLEADQLRAGETAGDVLLFQGIFQIPPGHARMLAGEGFCPLPFVVGYRIDNAAMLVR
jgi:hypothetical protein